MNLLFYRYGSICEPDILEIFQKMNLQVIECNIEIKEKHLAASQKVNALLPLFSAQTIHFVFSINYFPHLSELCERLCIPYVCWSVDCPVLELFSNTIHNKHNYIFLFDYAQYLRFHSENPEHIFYLPLATNVTRWDNVLNDLTQEDYQQYSSDISFVGSLYHEKSPLSTLNSDITIDEYWQGYFKGITEAQLITYGYNFLEDAISNECVQYLKQTFPTFYAPNDTFTSTDSYVAAHYYLGMHVAELERVRTLNRLAENHNVSIYTRSNTSLLKRVDCRGGVTTHVQMPKIFHLSKINLNITMRPIQTGLSLRIWDILGCGGFLLSNYQQELPEYFVIGKELDCYENMDELKEKVEFYLSHEDIRKEIAHKGYEKVKAMHTYEVRIASILKTIFADIISSGP